MNRALLGAVTVAWLLAVAGGLVAVTERTGSYAAQESAQLLTPPPLSRLDPRLIDVATLGYRGLYDDIIDIWMIQVLVDDRIATQKPDELYHLVQTVTHLHPHLESLYMISCFVLALDLKHPEDCERITLDGLKAFPDSWRIPVTQGFMDAYKLNDPQSAAMYYGLAASRPHAPDFLKHLAQRLVDERGLNPDELQQTMDHLLEAPGGSRFGSFLKQRAGTGQRPNQGQ